MKKSIYVSSLVRGDRPNTLNYASIDSFLKQVYRYGIDIISTKQVKTLDTVRFRFTYKVTFRYNLFRKKEFLGKLYHLLSNPILIDYFEVYS